MSVGHQLIKVLSADATGTVRQPRVRLTKFAWWWLGALWLALLGQWLVGRLDDTTLLSPDHDAALGVCFIVAGIVTLASAVVGYSQSTGTVAWRLTATVLIFGMLGALSTVLLTTTVAEIMLGRRYFAPDKTETFDALLPIGRAYRIRSSRVIQPTAFRTNIDITRTDYDFIATNGQTTYVRDEPRDIPGHGIFCAKVTMQRSGNALRVLHAGSSTLPIGSVIRCPQAAVGQPYLEVQRWGQVLRGAYEWLGARRKT